MLFVATAAMDAASVKPSSVVGMVTPPEVTRRPRFRAMGPTVFASSTDSTVTPPAFVVSSPIRT